MAGNSKFTNKQKLSKGEASFEKWLSNKDYFAVSDFYPGAIEASALLDEFLDENPLHNINISIIKAHAEDIGWISDYEDVDYDDDVDDRDEPTDSDDTQWY